jgi:hypothetical protein
MTQALAEIAPPSLLKPSKLDLTYRQWLPLASPEMNWDWDYLVHIAKKLEQVATGEIDRLMIFVPPQHGKSQIGTIRFPVYMLECDPTLRVIVGSFNQQLANKFLAFLASPGATARSQLSQGCEGGRQLGAGRWGILFSLRSRPRDRNALRPALYRRPGQGPPAGQLSRLQAGLH